MPRQVRIEFPGAYYHVMARGNRREPIVFDDADRKTFLRTLGEACIRAGFRVHAFVYRWNVQPGRGGLPVPPGLLERGRHRPRPAADPAASAKAVRAPRGVAGRGDGVDARVGAQRRLLAAHRGLGCALGPRWPGSPPTSAGKG